MMIVLPASWTQRWEKRMGSLNLASKILPALLYWHFLQGRSHEPFVSKQLRRLTTCSNCICLYLSANQSWALPVFFHLLNNKKWFFCTFIMLITYFCTSLFKKPTPSQINLIKNEKNHFLLVKKLKNTGSAQLCCKRWTAFSLRQWLFSSYPVLIVSKASCTHPHVQFNEWLLLVWTVSYKQSCGQW